MPSIEVSAGLLMFRKRAGEVEVFLVHPGGPFFAKKDAGVWTIPKGRVEAGEDLLVTAKREFEEETGFKSSPPSLSLARCARRVGRSFTSGLSRVTATHRSWLAIPVTFNGRPTQDDR